MSVILGLLLLNAGMLGGFLWMLRDQAKAHERERRAFRDELACAHAAHRKEVADLHQARVEEVANLLQRIQAPEQAVVTHAATTAPPDPPPVNLDDDEALYDEYRQRFARLGVSVDD